MPMNIVTGNKSLIFLGVVERAAYHEKSLFLRTNLMSSLVAEMSNFSLCSVLSGTGMIQMYLTKTELKILNPLRYTSQLSTYSQEILTPDSLKHFRSRYLDRDLCLGLFLSTRNQQE